MGFRTERDLERLALPPGKAEVFHFDGRCPGLSVRIQRSGKPAFVVWYSTGGGKRKRMTLGPVAGIDLDDARRQAAATINAARDGRDPGMERKQARAAAGDVLTLGALIASYMTHHAAKHQRPRTLIETRRHLEKNFAQLRDRPAVEVTRRDVAARLLELAAHNGPVAANRTRSSLSACFAWAMRAGLVEHNPVIGAIKPGEEAPRERVLAPEELRAIWLAAGALAGYGRILRLLVLTGARRTEVGGMRWGELDLERAIWTLPGERAKNGRAHEVPLSRQAIAVLAEVPQPVDAARQPYLFGRKGRSAFSGWSRCKERLDEQLAAADAGVAEFTLHDLRRSVVTHMAEIGVAPHIVEAVVGHVSGHKAGVAGIYNKAVYRAEKAAALQRWADWLEAVVGREPGSNVVALRA